MFLLDVLPDYPRDPAPAPAPAPEPGLFDTLSQQDLTIALIAIGAAIVVLLAIIAFKKK